LLSPEKKARKSEGRILLAGLERCTTTANEESELAGRLPVKTAIAATKVIARRAIDQNFNPQTGADTNVPLAAKAIWRRRGPFLITSLIGRY
jgi:hypothetical protein